MIAYISHGATVNQTSHDVPLHACFSVPLPCFRSVRPDVRRNVFRDARLFFWTTVYDLIEQVPTVEGLDNLGELRLPNSKDRFDVFSHLGRRRRSQSLLESE